jgi:hypothetical protein
MTPLQPITAALLVLSPAFAGDAKNPVSSGGDWEFSLSAGPAVRTLGQVKINSGYRSGGYLLPSLVGPDSLTVPPVGDTGSYADREYDDGYVRQDAGTPFDGTTWHWGHDNASQVEGDELVFHATGFQSIRDDGRSAPNAGPASKDTLDGMAPHLQFDARSPYHLGPFRIGFSAGFDFMKADQSLAFSNFSARQALDNYRLDYEDRFDLDGVIPPLAPYAGSIGGPGPLIGNVPVIRSITPVLISTDTGSFRNQVSSSIEIEALSFTFGPTFSLRQGPLEFAVSSGVIVNLYDWSARQSESLDATTTAATTRVANWHESDSGTKVRPGLFAQAELSYAVTEQVGLGGFLRLDAAGEFRAQAGPTVYKIDPYGVTAGFQVRFMLD